MKCDSDSQPITATSDAKFRKFVGGHYGDSIIDELARTAPYVAPKEKSAATKYVETVRQEKHDEALAASAVMALVTLRAELGSAHAVAALLGGSLGPVATALRNRYVPKPLLARMIACGLVRE
jgi:hypothetical protein